MTGGCWRREKKADTSKGVKAVDREREGVVEGISLDGGKGEGLRGAKRDEDQKMGCRKMPQGGTG